MWRLNLKHFFIFKHLLLLLLVLQYEWPLAKCDVNSLPIVPSSVSTLPSRDLIIQSSTYSPENLGSRESDINHSLENYLNSREKIGLHGEDYSQEYPVSTEVPQLQDELPKPEALTVATPKVPVLQVNAPVADLNIPAESQISSPVLANQMQPKPKSDIIYMQGFNPMATPQERILMRHSVRKRIRVPVYTTVYSNHRVIPDRPRGRRGRRPRPRPRGRRVKRRRRGRGGRGRRPPPLRHMATHQMPAYAPAFVSYGPVFGPAPLSNHPQTFGPQFPMGHIAQGVMGGQHAVMSSQHNVASSQHNLIGGHNVVGSPNVMYVPILHQGPAPGPAGHGPHIMLPTATYTPPVQQAYPPGPSPQPTYLPPNTLPPPADFKYPSITISLEADSNHIQSHSVGPGHNRHPKKYGPGGRRPSHGHGPPSAPTNFPAGFGPLPSYSNNEPGYSPAPGPPNQAPTKPAYGVAIPIPVPSNSFTGPTIPPPSFAPPKSNNLYAVPVPVPPSQAPQFVQTNMVPYVPISQNNHQHFGNGPHGPPAFGPPKSPQGFGPPQYNALPSMPQTYNAPQPFSSHNAPTSFGDFKGPESFGSFKPPESFGPHKAPEPFSSQKESQSYGAPNSPQRYQSPGPQNYDPPKSQAFGPPNDPPMNFGHPMHNFGPPKSSFGQPPPIMGDSTKDHWAPPTGYHEYPGGQGFINDPPSKGKYRTSQNSYDEKGRGKDSYNHDGKSRDKDNYNYDGKSRDKYSNSYDQKPRDQHDYSYDRKNSHSDNYISNSNKYPENNDIPNDNHPSNFFNPPKELKGGPGPSFDPPTSDPKPFFDTSEFHNDYTTPAPPRRYRKRRPKPNSQDSQSSSPAKNTYWAGESNFNDQSNAYWKEPWGSYHQREPNAKTEPPPSNFDSTFNFAKAKLLQPTRPSFTDNQAGQSLGHFDGFQNQPKKRPRARNSAQTPPEGRPHPNYDTNYNSPGMSKDPKVTDWMGYGDYSEKEKLNMGYPRKHRKKSHKYSTLPQSFDSYDPDPNHNKYPKLTYDTLSRRILPDDGPDFIPEDAKHSISKTGDEFKKMLKDHDSMRL